MEEYVYEYDNNEEVPIFPLPRSLTSLDGCRRPSFLVYCLWIHCLFTAYVRSEVASWRPLVDGITPTLERMEDAAACSSTHSTTSHHPFLSRSSLAAPSTTAFRSSMSSDSGLQTLFDAIILGGAYVSISEFLKNRPAQTSEFRPLNGFELATNAELALKDAEKAINIKSNSVRAYMNLLQRLVDTLFAVHVYFSLWIVATNVPCAGLFFSSFPY
uniref:Uncharacterized protein n=1 Tax=Kalanchoe fedtschenkoi TaxID=63787 RepID=A0A7N0UQ73_KALFE